MKEIAGHISDAVNEYQVTSDEQRMKIVLLRVQMTVKTIWSTSNIVVESLRKVLHDDKFKISKFVLPVNTKSASVSDKGNTFETSKKFLQSLKWKWLDSQIM